MFHVVLRVAVPLLVVAVVMCGGGGGGESPPCLFGCSLLVCYCESDLTSADCARRPGWASTPGKIFSSAAPPRRSLQGSLASFPGTSARCCRRLRRAGGIRGRRSCAPWRRWWPRAAPTSGESGSAGGGWVQSPLSWELELPLTPWAVARRSVRELANLMCSFAHLAHEPHEIIQSVRPPGSHSRSVPG